MSIIKSLSVGNGDMFYIRHNGSNFTIIDCCLSDENRSRIVKELETQKAGKVITRFISTHPDEDHVEQLDFLDDKLGLLNFYCVRNSATKPVLTPGFQRYRTLRDSTKAFNIFKGCRRKWMNESGPDDSGTDHGCAGIHVLWPDPENRDYKAELARAAAGEAYNNMSPIFYYSLNNGVTALWMGDLETEFMERILDVVEFPIVHILFAPHHGRKSGRVPAKWIERMNPDIIVMGEAESENSDYTSYPDRNIIRQNSAWDITFDCVDGKVHCYSSNPEYSVDFLKDEQQSSLKHYIGTLTL